MVKSFSVMRWSVLFLIIPSTFVIFSSKQDSSGLKILPAENYPRWLMNNVYQTAQTSGIAYLRENEDGKEEFLLADDIGKIHRLFIKDDTLFSFKELNFNAEVTWYFKNFPKLDFEEILYDKFTNQVYISIEGNGDNHQSFHGIYKFEFKDNNIFQDSIVGLEKLSFTPAELFYSDLRPNIGYEGLAVDVNFFYFGMEAMFTPEGSFSGHTVIRIADKKSLVILKEISTENLDISTVCGLYSDENYSLLGIDRNSRKVFKLKLDEYFNIVEINYFEIKTVIPNFTQFEYVGSLESITLTSNNFLFLVDDPWSEFFIPPAEILNKLDDRTIKNFNNFIPVIYKFAIE